MTVDDAAEELRRRLADAGFGPASPDPAAAWVAFKQFAGLPVDVPTSELWFEAGDGEPATGSPAYFDFVRLFSHYDDGASWDEQVTAHFFAPPDVQIGLNGRSVHAADVSDLAPWYAAVEESPAFQAGLRFAGWSFEVRIDGC